MKISVALAGVLTICVDSAPFIYYLENHPTYFTLVNAIFQQVDQDQLSLTTSTLTLTEVLMKPFQANNTRLQQEYSDLLLNTANVTSTPLDASIAILAADLRSRYNLRTPDAIQIATGIHTGADAFLTNDKGLRRVTEITVLLLDDLEL